MTYLIYTVWFILGAIIGATFADIDLAPPLPFKHRSAWTHGPVIPLAMLWLVSVRPNYWPFMVGFLVAYAVHMLADMFPKGWIGGSLIKLHPIPITLPPILSFIYLAAGVVSAIWAAAQVSGIQVSSLEELWKHSLSLLAYFV